MAQSTTEFDEFITRILQGIHLSDEMRQYLMTNPALLRQALIPTIRTMMNFGQALGVIQFRYEIIIPMDYLLHYITLYNVVVSDSTVLTKVKLEQKAGLYSVINKNIRFDMETIPGRYMVEVMQLNAPLSPSELNMYLRSKGAVPLGGIGLLYALNTLLQGISQLDSLHPSYVIMPDGGILDDTFAIYRFKGQRPQLNIVNFQETLNFKNTCVMYFVPVK